MNVRTSSRQLLTMVVLPAAAFALTACFTNEGVSDGECTSLPSEVKVAVVKDQTGVNAVVGIDSIQGIEVALDEVNASGDLGDTEVVLDIMDTANMPQTAATHVTSALNDHDVTAILGPVISEQAQATSPIADRGQIPIIYNQSGSDGVVTGDWTFRVSPPLPTYYGQVVNALESRDVQSLSIISANDNPTLIELGQLLADEADARGIDVTNHTEVPQTLQDFSSPVSKILADQPDAVGVLVFGSAFATLRQELDQAGFDGTVVSFPGVVISIETVAEAAVGTTWPTNFDAASASGVGKKFVTAYQQKYGEPPSNYAAEGYDSMMWLAKALQAAGCASRSAVRDALVDVAETGFTGAQGKLTFEDGRDARTEGLLVQWDGNGVVPFRQ